MKERLLGTPAGGFASRARDLYREHDVGLFAGALTYHAFLSLFPLLLLGATVLGLVFERNPGARAEWAARLATAMPGLGGLLEEMLVRASQTKAVAGLVGLAGLLWTSAAAVRAAGAALGRIFGCGSRVKFVRMVGWILGSLAGLGSIFVVSATATSFVGSADAEGPAGVALAAGAFAFGLGADVLLFLCAYRLLTRGEGPPFRALLPGAALAALGWSLLRLVGVWYFTRSLHGAQAVYGVFAGTVAVLVILSAGARLFLAGAVVNVVWGERFGARAPMPSSSRASVRGRGTPDPVA